MPHDTRAPRADPHSDRRTFGVVTPERITQPEKAGDTHDQDGIEIDNAIERPKAPDQPN